MRTSTTRYSPINTIVCDVTMNEKQLVETAIGMNCKSMFSASIRGDWMMVENLRRINDSMISAYEKAIGAMRV